MAERILILSASVGAGHTRAAQAVELALRELAPAATVQNVDVLSMTNIAFRRVYGKAYLDLVNKAPYVLGLIYDMMDKPVSPKHPGDRLRLLVEKLNLTRFQDMLKDAHWDVVVNTHFLPAEIIASLRKRGKIAQRQMTVTTDFETHRLWANEPTEHYTTATAEGAAYLTTFGVPAEHTSVTGIPIHPAFSKPVDRQACLSAHGLIGDRPIILQLAGGFGVGPIAKLYSGLLAIHQPLEIVVVAGKNETVKAELEKLIVPDRHRAKVLGFTHHIHELMAVADVIMSKPGGLTTSEVLASGAAMAIVNPIPGQESRNSDYLLEQGAAIKINNLATMAVKLEDLLGSPGKLDAIKANARRIAKPDAAYDIARLALGYGRPN
jgi:processive 1,2-diacylglycerol beta-glucosyltransferase